MVIRLLACIVVKVPSDSFVLSPVPALGYGKVLIPMQWIPMHRILVHSFAFVLIEMDTNGMHSYPFIVQRGADKAVDVILRRAAHPSRPAGGQSITKCCFAILRER